MGYVYSIIDYLAQGKLSAEEEKGLKICLKWFKAGCFLLAFTVLQWHFAHTELNGWVFNTYLETISEWTLITLAMRFPVQLSQVLNYSIVVIRQDKLD